MSKSLFIVFAAALSFWPSRGAAESIETLAVSAGAGFQAASFHIPEKNWLQQGPPAPAQAGPSQNKIGTITGGMNRFPADLIFDKRAWKITGGLNGSPVDVLINHGLAMIVGEANHSPVDLRFDWSPERVVTTGGANQSPINLTADWTKGTLDGAANHGPVHLDFDMEAGTIQGAAGHAPVELHFDKVSGKLTGGIGRAPVDVQLTNLDLYDFIQYFWLFLK